MTVIPMSYAVGRSLAILILCLAASLTTLYAGEPWVTVNPGLRFGHVFGEGGGFVAGVEVSVVRWPSGDKRPYTGVLVGADRFGKGADGGRGIG